MKTFKYLQISFGLLSLVFLSSCGQSSEDGQCSLSCSSPIIGSPAGHQLRTQDNTDTEYFCTAADDTAVSFARPLRRTFLAFTNAPAVQTPGAYSPPATTADNIIGVPNISFQVNIEGAVDGCRTNQENATVTTVGTNSCSVDPYFYAGITTPKSEWCTDSCGIATVEFWPVCLGGATTDVEVSIKTGALSGFNQGAAYLININGTN